MKKELPYNPLELKNVAISVADAMLEKEVEPLPPAPFKGAGIYALYYVGSFAPYKKLSNQNLTDEFSAPIYIGKAIPPGGRKGADSFLDYDGSALYSRLLKHSQSIKQTKNLKIEDFKCRFLVTQDIWIPLGESLLIKMFRPLWNLKVDGFGNHDPGSGRAAGKISAWDVLHPGRKWVEKLTGGRGDKDIILNNIKSFLEQAAAPESTIKKPRRKKNT